MTSNKNEIPGLFGLVLAGGKSLRMGQAKEKMQWNGKEQKFFAADLLKNFCSEVFISCREQQLAEIHDYQGLSDTFLNMGPLSGILSALRFNREKAWLVLACDLPLMDAESLQQLVSSRDAQKIATAFKSPFDDLPEPLACIWEPDAYAVLLNFLAKEMTCPRKTLIQNEIELVEAKNPDALLNANTPADAAKVEEILKRKK